MPRITDKISPRRGPSPEWSFFMLPEDHKEVKWAMSFFRAKFTLWGQIIFGLILVGLAISSVGTQAAGYFFVSLIWALFFTSLFLSSFFKPTIIATRILPAALTAGGVCLYRVVVKNTGVWPIRNLGIFDHKLPYGLYEGIDHPEQKTSIDWLEPDQEVILTMALRIPRRGSFVLEPLIIGSSFPTGLMRSILRAGGRAPFVVFPKRIRFNNPILLLQMKFQPGGTNATAKFGHSNEFLSTREYREGDRPRDIHWNSSARAGKLIVKEYVDEYFVRVGLFVDTELKRFEKHLCFEARLSLCAGLAEDFYNKNYLVDLFLSDIHSPVTHIGGGRDQLNRLMEMLSAVEGEDRVNFSHPLALMRQAAFGMSGFIVFLKDWDQERADFVTSLRELNVPLQVMIVREKPVSIPVSDPSVAVMSPKELGYQI